MKFYDYVSIAAIVIGFASVVLSVLVEIKDREMEMLDETEDI